jgi:uncharacterized repeat protein (TIGR03803 family)
VKFIAMKTGTSKRRLRRCFNARLFVLGGVCRPAWFLPSLLVGLGMMLAGPVAAQTFRTLHGFTNGIDGAYPFAGLTLSGNTLYGVAVFGGSAHDGTVFALNTDRTGFTTLYSFTNGTDGADPKGGLVLSGNTLYGTASTGSSLGAGTVFALNTDGSGFRTLHQFAKQSNSPPFTNSDGANPQGALILSANTLYGTTQYGTGSDGGTVFAVNIDGTGFTNLHNFAAISPPNYTNSGGAGPYAGVILSGNTLYGTAYEGGSSGFGTIFKLNTNGSGFTTLHNFSNGSDGAYPYAGLTLSGNTLYGVTQSSNAVFKINTDGSGFTTLFTFPNSSEGAVPDGALILSGNTLYGTAYEGDSSGHGGVFKVNIDGSGFANLYRFTGGTDGANPVGGLILSDYTLYGTAYGGGSSEKGTVFSLSLPAPSQLAILRSGTNVILTWPTIFAGFTLESTTNLSPEVWITGSPGPVVVNGQNTVTNPISGTQQFYRLSQ